MRLSVVLSGVVAALVGFGGTLALIVAAAQAVGADAAETSSWVAALCLAVAATTIYLSIRYRMPIVTAWSTPGAALIAASAGGIGLDAAVGEFYALGLGDPVAVSAEHGLGVSELLERVAAELPAEEEEPADEGEVRKLAIVGRPNVGKSSLLNAMGREERSIGVHAIGLDVILVKRLDLITGRATVRRDQTHGFQQIFLIVELDIGQPVRLEPR